MTSMRLGLVGFLLASIQRSLCALPLMLFAAGCASGASVGGGGGVGGNDCDEIRTRCLPLNEAECEADPECDPIRGTAWEGNTEECLAKPAQFLECGGCLVGYDAPGCVHRESDSEQCYCMQSTITIPGWVDVFECEPPEGVCGTTMGFDTRELDLRGFERFRIDQTPWITASGCPTPYLVDPAVIERTAEGEYELTFSIAFASEEEFELCLRDAVDPDECDFAEPVPGPSRELDQSDLAELMDLFSAVSVSFAPNPCGGDDPCNVNELEWDDLTTTDLYCEQTQPWVGRAFASEVLRVVTELAQPPPGAGGRSFVDECDTDDDCPVGEHCSFDPDGPNYCFPDKE